MATRKTGATGTAAPLDPEIVHELLDRLSTDNGFRRLFKKDPTAALAQLGHTGTPLQDSSMACLSVTRIAPKEEIAAARQELAAHLTSHAAQTIPHCFEAGRIASTLRRR